MKLVLILNIIVISILLNGCGNSMHHLGDPQYMPKNWLSLSENSWQFKELPEANKIELQDLKIKFAQAKQGQYYSFYQNYSPELLSEFDRVMDNLNQAYLELQYSNKAIAANLTPNMNGLAETRSQNDASIGVVNNENERMYIDDWRRLMLLDKPSSLTPYPITGN